jgi:hypothetical protein
LPSTVAASRPLTTARRATNSRLRCGTIASAPRRDNRGWALSRPTPRPGLLYSSSLWDGSSMLHRALPESVWVLQRLSILENLKRGTAARLLHSITYSTPSRSSMTSPPLDSNRTSADRCPNFCLANRLAQRSNLGASQRTSANIPPCLTSRFGR